MSLYLGTTPIAVSGASRNIGEIIQSTIPLTDAGLHLLDGSVINGAGSYADFVTYIAGLVSGHSELFTTEANWQSSVSTYGVCGKFVYDSTNNTVRLPKITGFTEGTTDVTALGDLVEAGLPNITGFTDWWSFGQGSNLPSGAFYTDSYTNNSPSSGGNPAQLLRFDASRSNSIYGNSSTVQPQSIKVLYYIVIATMTKTDIQVDIDEVMTDLNGKVDKADLATCHVVIETYKNGTDWYRIYSDGWCEQGGRNAVSGDGTYTVYLLKQYIDTNYTITQWSGLKSTYSTQYNNGVSLTAINSDSFSYNSYDYNNTLFWRACGYIS